MIRRPVFILAALLCGLVAVPDALAQPDLQILRVTVLPRTRVDAPMVVSARVANTGQTRAPASLLRFSARGVRLGSFRIPPLAHGRSFFRKARLRARVGRYTVVACADARHRIAENSERNNCARSRMLSIAPSPAPPTITERPPALTNATGGRFAFSGGRAFECSLDQGGFARCASPAVYSGLAEGAHTFRVRTSHGRGRVGRSATVAWRIDITPPGAPRIVGHPAVLTNSPTASFTIDVERDATLACRINESAFFACGSSESWQLAQGIYELAVRATDAAGNQGPAASFRWRIDLTAPPAPVVRVRPPTQTYLRLAQIDFDFPPASEPTTRDCRFDGAPVSCAAPLRLPGPMKPGPHAFVLAHRDEAGNEAPARVDWTILRRDDGLYGGPYGAAPIGPFASWRGTPVHRVLEYLLNATWDDISGLKAQQIIERWRGSPYEVVLSTPMLPATGATLQEGARGAYDSHFDALARKLVAAGRRDAVIRLGWEFNGDWFSWSAVNDPAAFIAFWRRIVTAMRAVSSDFRFDWCPNSGPSRIDADLAYPGDSYVDYVGVSSFDAAWGAPPTPTPAWRWGVILNQPFGLAWQRDFAAAHSKPMTYPEWGLWQFTDPSYYNGQGSDGRDDPFYIERMFEWLNANEVAYALYFEYDSPVGLHRLGNFPNGQARYKALFGGL